MSFMQPTHKLGKIALWVRGTLPCGKLLMAHADGRVTPHCQKELTVLVYPTPYNPRSAK